MSVTLVWFKWKKLLTNILLALMILVSGEGAAPAMVAIASNTSSAAMFWIHILLQCFPRITLSPSMNWLWSIFLTDRRVTNKSLGLALAVDG